MKGGGGELSALVALTTTSPRPKENKCSVACVWGGKMPVYLAKEIKGGKHESLGTKSERTMVSG